MAQFMGKHIPGNPNFIVQNMTGAGSIIGANYLYNVSKPDGLTIGAIQPSIYFNQLMKQKEVRYDWAKFALDRQLRQVRLSSLYARRSALQNFGRRA